MELIVETMPGWATRAALIGRQDIDGAVADFTRGEAPFDDITCLAIRWAGPGDS